MTTEEGGEPRENNLAKAKGEQDMKEGRMTEKAAECSRGMRAEYRS